ncbi:MAG: DUF6570 domain-containing protein, partial [Gaiellaceae bacterium]
MTEDEEAYSKDKLNQHLAPVCVICDRFIIGTEKLKWISSDLLARHEKQLSALSYGKDLPEELLKQYRVNDPKLKHLLLSPRATVKKDHSAFQTCSSCRRALKINHLSGAPPKHAISNGFAIGHLPVDIGEISDLMSIVIAPIRPYGYVVVMRGGRHKAIQGSYTFFHQNVAYINKAMSLIASGRQTASICAVFAGRFTNNQRLLARRHLRIDYNIYQRLFNFMQLYHQSFTQMPKAEDLPEPIILEDEPSSNNTDVSSDIATESNIQTHFYFPSVGDPCQTTGTYDNSTEFATALLRGTEPTLVFHPEQYARDKDLEIYDLFPVQFPFGEGSIKVKQQTKISTE